MSSLKLTGFVVAGVLALGALTITSGQAAPAERGFSGSTRSSVAGCPYIIWRLVRDANGKIHGIAYFSDLSGISSVKGTRDAEGNFELNVTPTSMGSGPSGHVTGHAGKDGGIVAKLVGDGCANATVDIPALEDLNKYPKGQ